MPSTWCGFWIKTVPLFSRTCRPILVWDIDGTLLAPRGVGRDALTETAAELYGLDDAFAAMTFSGATDHALVEDALNRYNVTPSKEFFERYVSRLRNRLQQDPLTALPGVIDLIAYLSASGWTLVLGTGNIRSAAYAKLETAGLAPYFPSGGFSVPNATREDIIDRAAQPFRDSGCPIIVIGDTPKDIKAAHANGFLSLGVSTGHHSLSELSLSGAGMALPHLTHWPTFFSALQTLTRA